MRYFTNKSHYFTKVFYLIYPIAKARKLLYNKNGRTPKTNSEVYYETQFKAFTLLIGITVILLIAAMLMQYSDG